MKFKVIFEYDEVAQKWEVFVQGATSPLEAVQGFNAVVMTAHQATPSVQCNQANIQPDGSYKISVGIFKMMVGVME